MDAEMASWKSTGTYVDKVPPPGANIVCGMWIFRVKQPPGSPPAFKARYVARGFSQRQGVDFFQTFSPTPKMTTLRVLLHVAAQHDYELHSLDFSTAFLQGNLHKEIWLRRPPGFTGSFPAGTQWSLQRPVYGLRQAPCEWHDTLRTTLVALGFAPSTSDTSLFLRTDTTLPPFYILVYVDDLVFATADTEALAHVNTSGMGLVLGGRARVVLTGHADASWVDDLATQRSSPGYSFNLGSGSVSWRSTRSSYVLSSSCEAEIYPGAMAAQELRWLTYLPTDLGEAPHSPPVLMKHIALRYFLARELHQCGQLRLAYVASQANTADVFTKALQPCDHQHPVKSWPVGQPHASAAVFFRWRASRAWRFSFCPALGWRVTFFLPVADPPLAPVLSPHVVVPAAPDSSASALGAAAPASPAPALRAAAPASPAPALGAAAPASHAPALGAAAPALPTPALGAAAPVLHAPALGAAAPALPCPPPLCGRVPVDL
ncbi:unnamed protein product [Closterium sp. NIES-53]